VASGQWLINYSREAQDIADGDVLLQRSKLRPDGWFTPAHLDMSLEFECLSTPHFLTSDVSGHFEQSGKVSGTVKLGDEQWFVEGLGVRDKSWGPRDWSMGQSTGGSRGGPLPSPHVHWFSMNFGPELALGGSALRQQDGSWLTVGSWLLRGEKTGYGISEQWQAVSLEDTTHA
jgi:hypothetical protein